MSKDSAAIVLCNQTAKTSLRVLIGHMGGPFWSRKDEGGWSVVKGEFDPETESSQNAALREFEEETGRSLSDKLIWVDIFKQPSGKKIHVWRSEEFWDLDGFKPGTFELEWPRGSGKMEYFPEIDKLSWFDISVAVKKVVKGQTPIIEKLADIYKVDIVDVDGSGQTSFL